MNRLPSPAPSRVLTKLRAGESVLCAKASYADAELVELIASSGVDAVWICQEHRRAEPALLYSMIQACRLGGADAYVRIKPSNHTDLAYVLEAGARGIMLPKVTDVAEVRRVVEMMRFPPLGRRGFDGIHPDADFGRLAPLDYCAHANENTFLGVQIEEPEVIDSIDAIAALPGVDLLFVGPADLSLNLGRFGDKEILKPVLEKVLAACGKHGKAAAIPCLPEEVAAYQEMGFRFLNITSDFRCISAGLRAAVETARGSR